METVTETAGASPAAESDVSSVIPHYDMRFYLKNLDPSLQEDVIALYSGIKEFSPKIELPEWTTAENADLMVFVIKLDCPELFHVSDSGRYTITTTNGMANAVSLPYSMTKEQYDERLEDICSTLKLTSDTPLLLVSAENGTGRGELLGLLEARL